MASSEPGSPAFSFSGEDVKKVFVGAGMAATGALLTYFSEWASSTDFGVYTPAVVAGMSVLANVVRKYLTNTVA